MTDMNTRVKVKFNVSSDLNLRMEMTEVYSYKGYKGDLFDFDKEFVMVDTTIDKLHGAELRKLERTALYLYMGSLELVTKYYWTKADVEKRRLACETYNWLNLDFTGEQVAEAVTANTFSLYEEYNAMFTVMMYTE